MKIYVASSWRNEYQPDIVAELRSYGHEVYDFKNPHGGAGFQWSEVDPEWQKWTSEAYVDALNHPAADAGFNRDFDAMQWADACVMVLPCGRSANTEAGWMKGAGKLVYVIQVNRQEPELMYKLYDAIYTEIWQLKLIPLLAPLPEPDYRDLLAKYIGHVSDHEGIDYIEHTAVSLHSYELTAYERVLLRKAAIEGNIIWDRASNAYERERWFKTPDPKAPDA